jgi:phospholipase C
MLAAIIYRQLDIANFLLATSQVDLRFTRDGYTLADYVLPKEWMRWTEEAAQPSQSALALTRRTLAFLQSTRSTSAMIFTNETNREVELGVYTTDDRAYRLTIFDWGRKRSLRPGYNSFQTPGKFWRRWPKAFQVIFWVDGQPLGPKLCGQAGATLTQDKIILTGREYVEEQGAIVRQITMKDKIDHIVVVMLENRSFDNLLGWLYADRNNQPPRNIPAQQGGMTTYEGLKTDTYWNTNPAGDHDKLGATRVYATKGITGDKWWCVPNPNPHEVFPYFLEQMFGTEQPGQGQNASMTGFLANYARLGKPNPEQIMQSYSPEQVPVLSQLAKSFAVCDRWFGSVPCETWPNRSFVHAGTSFGRLNNLDQEYNDFGAPNFFIYAGKRTIFDVLDEQHISWKVYSDMGFIPSALDLTAGLRFMVSLTSSQFWNISQKLKWAAAPFEQFQSQAEAGHLPAYSFIEPQFFGGFNDRHPGPNDQHPADNCDIRRGEEFLFRIWQAVSTSPAWNRTLLVITYDEHGGCYDHLPPPRTATPPDASQPQFDRFTPWSPFTQWGVRVPAVLVSPYIEEGTVFRSGSGVEYDHTSILATLRDWIFRGGRTGHFLDSERVGKAPTLWPLLTRSTPRTDIPQINKPVG